MRGDAGRRDDAIAQVVEEADPVIAIEIGDERVAGEVGQHMLASDDVIGDGVRLTNGLK